jgi:hypothetical protein
MKKDNVMYIGEIKTMDILLDYPSMQQRDMKHLDLQFDSFEDPLL